MILNHSESLLRVAHPEGDKVNFGLFTLRFSYDSKIYLEAPEIKLDADKVWNVSFENKPSAYVNSGV